MRILGLDIKPAKKKRPLVGAAADNVARKKAGIGGRYPGSGRKKGTNVPLTALERRQEAAKATILEEKAATSVLKARLERRELENQLKEPPNPIVQMREQITAFKEISEMFREETTDPSSNEGLLGMGKEALRELGAGFGMAFAQSMKDRQQQAVQPQPASPPSGPPTPLGLLTAPEPLITTPTPVQEAPAVQATPEQTDALLAQLGAKNPQEAAQWLLEVARGNAEIADLVGTLIRTPDDNLPALVTMIQFRNAKIAGFIRNNWERFILTVQYLRVYAQGGGVATAAAKTDDRDLGL